MNCFNKTAGLCLLLFVSLTAAAQNNPIFSGGWQDGFGSEEFSPPVNNAIFYGGWRDGFAEQRIIIGENNSIFAGGWQDGFAENTFEQIGNNSIFAGGWQDGFAENFFTQIANNSIFSGGWQDGFSENKYEQFSNNGIFAGGWQDGFAQAFFEQASNNSIFAGGFQDGFSEFSIEQNPANILPVKLLLLTAQLHGKTAMVEWSTAIEINSDYFDVERSLDAIEYEFVGWESAAGNSTTLTEYLFPDDVSGLMDQEVIYYRLKQVDLDGSFSYYGPVAIEIPQSGTQASIYPNPNDGRFELSFSEIPEDSYELAVWDATGREVFREKVKKGQLEKSRFIDLSFLASGTFICEVVNAQERFTEQLIILKN
jgi:hypothetical protein